MSVKNEKNIKQHEAQDEQETKLDEFYFRMSDKKDKDGYLGGEQILKVEQVKPIHETEKVEIYLDGSNKIYRNLVIALEDHIDESLDYRINVDENEVIKVEVVAH